MALQSWSRLPRLVLYILTSEGCVALEHVCKVRAQLLVRPAQEDMAQYWDWSLSKWPVFSLLGETFLRSLKLVCVFGASGSEAVVVTQDDQVYALGSNSNGCLGVGDLSASFEPRKIDELCNQGDC